MQQDKHSNKSTTKMTEKEKNKGDAMCRPKSRYLLY